MAELIFALGLTPPLLGNLLTAAGLCVVLYLFSSLGREIRLLEARLSKLGTAVDKLAMSTLLETSELKARLEQAERHAGMMVPPAPTRSGMNLNKRSEAIRLLRMGEPPDRVASALRLPAKEVELLAKVQKALAAGVG